MVGRPPGGAGISRQRVAPRRRVNGGDLPDSTQDHSGLEGRLPRGGPLAPVAMVSILRACGMSFHLREGQCLVVKERGPAGSGTRGGAALCPGPHGGGII